MFLAVPISWKQICTLQRSFSRFFVPLFRLSSVTTLKWSPSRAFRRAASCFGAPESFRAPQNTTCHVRLNMNFSSEKSEDGFPTASLWKNPSVGILITFCILKNATGRILERCNRMTYRVTGRQQAAMIVPIRKIYRYFAACQHVSGSSVIQVCVRYGVHGWLKPSGNGWTGICRNIIRPLFPHMWMRECMIGLMSDRTRWVLVTWPACRSDAHTRQIMQACNMGGILTFTT